MVETFFKAIKSELVWRTVFYTRAEAGQAIARYIDGFYNPVRRHSALDYLSPAQFERQAANRANASPFFRGKSNKGMIRKERKALIHKGERSIRACSKLM